MPPNNHAVLSASSSHRWMQCTPSARLEQEFEGSTSQAAAEGSAAHALAEHKLKRALKMRSQRPTSPYEDDAMDEYTTDYVSFVMEQFYEMKDGAEEDPLVLIEQRLDFSSYVPDGFGTGDAVLLAPGKLHVIDFKYGLGVLVDAEHNPQMMCYALGALDIYDGIYDIKTVKMTIFQPRRDNVSTCTMDKETLLTWADTVLSPTAKLAYEGKGEFNAGEHCAFCKLKATCRKRAEYNLELAKYDFEMPSTLEDTEIAAILPRVDDLVSWVNDIKEYALQQALSGTKYDGYKVVEGKSNRKYTDESAVASAVTDAGFDPYEKHLLGITAMTSLLGKTKFNELLGGLIEKPQGKPTLVPETDKRPALNTAKDDFKEE